MITHLGQLQCLRRDLTGLSPEAYAALDAAIVALTQPDATTSQSEDDDRWERALERATDRIVAAQTITSQPSGEACFRFRPAGESHFSNWIDGNAPAYPPGVEVQRAYTHPSADASGEAVDEWRPIESAPAGVPILVRYINRAGKERVIKARFIQRFTEESSGDCDEGVDEYDEANDRYTYCEGWWEMIDNWDDFAFIAVSEGSPTHWHKIPSTAALAPKQEGGHG